MSSFPSVFHPAHLTIISMVVVYLVSGANRGIGTYRSMRLPSEYPTDRTFSGLGLVTQLSTRPNTVVFAGARNPESAVDLKKLAADHSNVVHVVKLTSGDASDNAAAVDIIKAVVGRLDVVIANAGVHTILGSYPCNRTSQSLFLSLLTAVSFGHAGVFESTTADLRSHWDVNVGGPHVLFQKTLPLLRASPRDAILNPPKFIVISSTAGSTVGPVNYLVPYRLSKHTVNFLVLQMHREHEGDGLGMCHFA
jgi:NAD(P)-dependent dehydrogenase (short-subunit alcohol dehydrogenase family)